MLLHLRGNQRLTWLKSLGHSSIYWTLELLEVIKSQDQRLSNSYQKPAVSSSIHLSSRRSPLWWTLSLLCSWCCLIQGKTGTGNAKLGKEIHFQCTKKREAESVENGKVCRESGEVSFPTAGGGCGPPRQIFFLFCIVNCINQVGSAKFMRTLDGDYWSYCPRGHTKLIIN